MGVALGQLLPLPVPPFPHMHHDALSYETFRTTWVWGAGVNLPLQEIVEVVDGLGTEWGGVSSPFAGAPGCS